MSRKGSITRPTPLSVSATRKLALPSSGAGIASTVYIALERDGRRGQENVDRQKDDEDGAAVEDDLGRNALGGRHAEVDEQVAEAVREVEEGHRDQDEQIELHDRVADDVGVGKTGNAHEAQRSKDA